MVVDLCFVHYILKIPSFLVKARVGVEVGDRHDQVMENNLPLDRLIMLLKSVSNVKNLSLGGCCSVAAFSSASESNWPVFPNVTFLELDIREDLDNEVFSRWPLFPKLTHLKINVYEDFASKNFSDLLMLVSSLISLVVHKDSSKDNSKEFSSSEQLVPSCFRSCLGEIEVQQFDELQIDFNLLKYLLNNVELLEKITIRFSIRLRQVVPQKAKKFRSKIPRMPRWSKNCKFMFI